MCCIKVQQLREKAHLTFVQPKLEYATTVWNPHLTNDKIVLEEVQRCAARHVKGEYDVSVTRDAKKLEMGITRSRKEQFSLIMLYNILTQNTYLSLEYIPEY